MIRIIDRGGLEFGRKPHQQLKLVLQTPRAQALQKGKVLPIHRQDVVIV